MFLLMQYALLKRDTSVQTAVYRPQAAVSISVRHLTQIDLLTAPTSRAGFGPLLWLSVTRGNNHSPFSPWQPLKYFMILIVCLFSFFSPGKTNPAPSESLLRVMLAVETCYNLGYSPPEMPSGFCSLGEFSNFSRVGDPKRKVHAGFEDRFWVAFHWKVHRFPFEIGALVVNLST